MYVDKLLSGAKTIAEAREICHEIIQLLKEAKINMRQWASNDPSILRDIPSTDYHSNFSLTDESVLKTLGIFLNASEDSIVYTVNPISIQVLKQLSVSYYQKSQKYSILWVYWDPQYYTQNE